MEQIADPYRGSVARQSTTATFPWSVGEAPGAACSAALPRTRLYTYKANVPVLLALGALLLLFGLVFGPNGGWRRVMRHHAAERPDLPGTGGELACHLLDLARLEHVPVETAPADHYDPAANVVRLSPGNHDGCLITAITIAAHEVAHALQHAAGGRMMAAVIRYSPKAVGATAEHGRGSCPDLTDPPSPWTRESAFPLLHQGGMPWWV